MKKFLKCAAALIALVTTAELVGASLALARGGASNIMNSPGYQRRLQESRGYVTNQSGSIFATQPVPGPNDNKWRRRHRH
ncbi:hypothetical protein V1282_006600 [Nitrobacteraceae bacterium AZCC 2146]|jgi:hypothetical protein